MIATGKIRYSRKRGLKFLGHGWGQFAVLNREVKASLIVKVKFNHRFKGSERVS